MRERERDLLGSNEVMMGVWCRMHFTFVNMSRSNADAYPLCELKRAGHMLRVPL